MMVGWWGLCVRLCDRVSVRGAARNVVCRFLPHFLKFKKYPKIPFLRRTRHTEGDFVTGNGQGPRKSILFAAAVWRNRQKTSAPKRKKEGSGLPT